MNARQPANEPTRVQSVARAAQVLMFVASHDAPVTVKEAASNLGVPVPTTYHLLNTLVDAQLLAKDASRRYWLGPAVGALCEPYLRYTSPPDYQVEVLKNLVATTGQSCYISGWRANDIVVLTSISGSHAIQVSELKSGFTGFGHARASGKVLLAHSTPAVRDDYFKCHPFISATQNTVMDREKLEEELAEVRRIGYALEREEFRQDVCCVAAPVFDQGVVLSAYAVAVPATSFGNREASLIASVKAAAAAASREPIAEQRTRLSTA